jgi:Leucine-rich repeat (LRR) protein
VDLRSGLLTLSHPETALTIDSLPTPYLHITKLSLNYCGLSTLAGIEQFLNLTELSLKFNDLQHI